LSSPEGPPDDRPVDPSDPATTDTDAGGAAPAGPVPGGRGPGGPDDPTAGISPPPDAAVSGVTGPPRPGTGTFTIEGRSAPALFVIGWLGTLIGFGFLAVAIMAGGGIRATLLFVVGLVLLAIGLIAAAGSQGIERRVRATLPYRGPSPFLVFAATIPVSVLIIIVLSIPLAAVNVDLDGPIGALLSVTIQAIVYVGMVRLLVVDTGALDWRAMRVLPLDRTAVAEMGGGALWAIPVIFVTAIVAQVLLSIFPVEPTSPLPPTGTVMGFILSFVAGVLVAPFGEEILFRSFATTAWARGIGTRRALVVGALFFAFAHVLTITGASAGDAVGLAVVAFGGRIPVALALGWLFLRRNTIWASFGLHAAFNGVLLALAEVASRTL
jgi:membrane protease YdiL (CAAX protease family)